MFILFFSNFNTRTHTTTNLQFLLSIMPLSIFYGLRKFGLSNISALFVCLLFPLINDRPPYENNRQGITFSYGIGLNSQLHVGHGLVCFWFLCSHSSLFVDILFLFFVLFSSLSLTHTHTHSLSLSLFSFSFTHFSGHNSSQRFYSFQLLDARSMHSPFLLPPIKIFSRIFFLLLCSALSFSSPMSFTATCSSLP